MRGLAALLLALLLAQPGRPAAAAGCTRPIVAPLAALGLSVVNDGREARGVYPDLLRELGHRTECVLETPLVPRARLEWMFEQGQADLLIPASRSTARDAQGEFVPLVRVRAALISLRESELPPLSTLGDLLLRRELRVAVVRGFDFGDTYRQALDVLQRQGRLVQEMDAAGVARALSAGLADVTIMTPSILLSTVLLDERLKPLAERLRVENVEEFPWNESGVYLSRKRLVPNDRQLLSAWFTRAGKSRQVWALFNQHYPPGSLGPSIKPPP